MRAARRRRIELVARRVLAAAFSPKGAASAIHWEALMNIDPLKRKKAQSPSTATNEAQDGSIPSGAGPASRSPNGRFAQSRRPRERAVAEEGLTNSQVQAIGDLGGDDDVELDAWSHWAKELQDRSRRRDLRNGPATGVWSPNRAGCGGFALDAPRGEQCGRALTAEQELARRRERLKRILRARALALRLEPTGCICLFCCDPMNGANAKLCHRCQARVDAIQARAKRRRASDELASKLEDFFPSPTAALDDSLASPSTLVEAPSQPALSPGRAPTALTVREMRPVHDRHALLLMFLALLVFCCALVVWFGL
jgi:hypothetical protein